MTQPDYTSTAPYSPPADPFERFRVESGNQTFRHNVLTWLMMFFLLVLYPAQSLLGGGDFLQALKDYQGVLLVVLVVTVVVQWCIFMLLYATLYREGTGLQGIGLQKFRGIDILWAVSFLLASNLILAGLAWVLAQVGLPMPGEVAFLIPEDLPGRIFWVAVSFTAGFCEETAFRGYLLTRLRLLGRFQGWAAPLVISSLSFGACHAYQGWPGFIVITVYGAMFGLLYIRTGRLWPCILAHSLQDFSALFIPQ